MSLCCLLFPFVISLASDVHIGSGIGNLSIHVYMFCPICSFVICVSQYIYVFLHLTWGYETSYPYLRSYLRHELLGSKWARDCKIEFQLHPSIDTCMCIIPIPLLIYIPEVVFSCNLIIYQCMYDRISVASLHSYMYVHHPIPLVICISEVVFLCNLIIY